MKATLEKRILIFVFLVLTVAITVNAGFNIESFRRSYRDGVLLRIDHLLASFQSMANYPVGIPLAAMSEMASQCDRLLGTDPEISYCIIEDGMGQTVFGHSSLPLTEAQLVSGLDGSAIILEEASVGRIYDVSVPLHAADGSLLGRARMGFPESLLKERAKPMLNRSLMVLGAALLSVLAMVVLFTSRNLVGPIRRLCMVAREITSGNFQVAVPKMPTADFSELGTALQEMSRSLQMRDDAVLEGYQELEKANLLLQHSHKEQEKTSSELARSQQMYLALFESASDAIVISDQNHCITLFNRRAEEFFGISRDLMIGCNLFTALEKLRVDPEAQQKYYRQLLDNGRHKGEFTYVRASDFERVIGWVSGSVARDRNGSFWTQLIIRDITRERQVKEDLEKCARNMERLNQMKNSFLGLASHELKTPLTVIVGYADLILSGSGGNINPQVQEMVRYIAEAAERLSGVVRDMVDVSMLDGERLPLEICRSVDINSLVRKVAEENAPFLSHRGQRIQLVCHPDLSMVEGDSDRLQQAFGHLLGNAIKFTPDGGLVTVETRPHVNPLRPAAAVGGSEKVEIVIQDTGIGIDETDRPHIFDKFFEGGDIEEHFSGKVAFCGRGAGLGLTIARGIVELHGGRIWVESPGHDPNSCPGSTFHVLLPVCRSAGGP